MKKIILHNKDLSTLLEFMLKKQLFIKKKIKNYEINEDDFILLNIKLNYYIKNINKFIQYPLEMETDKYNLILASIELLFKKKVQEIIEDEYNAKKNVNNFLNDDEIKKLINYIRNDVNNISEKYLNEEINTEYFIKMKSLYSDLERKLVNIMDDSNKLGTLEYYKTLSDLENILKTPIKDLLKDDNKILIKKIN